MKAWIISMILFLLILALVIIQSFVVQRLTRDMLLLLETLSQDAGQDDEAIKKLTAMWEARKALLSLTVSHKILNEIDHALTDLQVSFEIGDLYSYRRAQPQLQSAVEALRDAEGFSLQSLI